MRTPLDYSGPHAALAWFVFLCVFVGLMALLMWLFDVAERHVTRAVDAALAPEPEPESSLRACVVVAGRRSHDYRQTRDSEGREWHVCKRCGETVRRVS
jgi:hypothetical protein